MLNNGLKFPDGTGFYPDTKDGINGYNTSEERGADTFHPFSNNKADLLWKNPNPTSGFGAVTVPLDLSNYDGVLIQSNVTIYTGSGVAEPNTFSFVAKGKTARVFGADQAKSLKTEITTRLASVSDTGVTFTYGYFPNSGETDGGFCVPKYIYGIKISF